MIRPHSLAARIALTCTLLVLLTAAGLVWFAHTGTITALRQTERRSLDNILYLVERELSLLHSLAVEERGRAVPELQAELQSLARRAAAGLSSQPPERVPAYLDGLVTGEQGRRLLLCRKADDMWAGGGGVCSGGADMLGTLPPRGRFGFVNPSGPEGKGDVEFSHLAFFLPLELAGHPAVLISAVPSGMLNEREAEQKRRAEAGIRDLLRNIHIQQTGFVAVLDSQGRTLAGTEQAHLPEALIRAALDPQMITTPRRLMVLPGERGDVLDLLAYFRPYAWQIVLAAPLDELEAPAFALVERQLLITLAVAGFALLAGLALARLVAKPVRALTVFARSLPEQDMLSLDMRTFLAGLPDEGRGEVGELARSFRYMTGELSRNVRELVASTAVRQRLEGELAVARDIQFGMLPTVFTTTGAVELAADMATAKEVGGDLYDSFQLDDGRLCFVIGDVSDKGIPAALFMSMTVTLARVALKDDRLPPEAAMARINDTLSRDNPRSMFVTLLLGILDPATGDVVWASGGHMPPIRLGRPGADGAVAALPASGDMVVGGFDGLPFQRLTARLEPGEALFLYTDGVSEAMNPDLEQYGEPRLLEFLHHHAGEDAPEIIRAVAADVAAHAAGAEQSDDITMLVLRWRGPSVEQTKL